MEQFQQTAINVETLKIRFNVNYISITDDVGSILNGLAQFESTAGYSEPKSYLFMNLIGDLGSLAPLELYFSGTKVAIRGLDGSSEWQEVPLAGSLLDIILKTHVLSEDVGGYPLSFIATVAGVPGITTESFFDAIGLPLSSELLNEKWEALGSTNWMDSKSACTAIDLTIL